MKTPPTPAQIRETAQIIFPSEWREDPLTATMLAIKLLAEAVADAQPLPAAAPLQRPKPSQRTNLVTELSRFFESCPITHREAAIQIGVHELSLSQWLRGTHAPKQVSRAKIRRFLDTYRPGLKKLSAENNGQI
jgi:hypothetical protein